MNNTWDRVLPDKRIWEECHKVLKPGAFLLAMGATRMYHRLACDIEDAGFKIKDCIIYGFASGFSHGKNLSKEIDKYKGVERPVVGKRIHPTLKQKPKSKSRAYLTHSLKSDETMESWDITAPGCEESEKWHGWNTQLKPACEFIVCAQKSLEGTYVENVLKYNIGGINIDACRIPYEDEDDMEAVGSFENFAGKDRGDKRFFSANVGGKKQVNVHPGGRYPANLMYFDKLFPGQYDKFFMIPKPDSVEKYGVSHDTVKPIELFCRLIKMFTPDPSTVKSKVLVLDPFVGSGTTAIACNRLERDFVGFEIDLRTCKEAKERIGRFIEKQDIFASQ